VFFVHRLGIYCAILAVKDVIVSGYFIAADRGLKLVCPDFEYASNKNKKIAKNSRKLLTFNNYLCIVTVIRGIVKTHRNSLCAIFTFTKNKLTGIIN
jgi:hypothetical protein